MKRCVSIATLAEYLGDAAAARLVAHFGGTQIKVPQRRAGKTWGGLVMALGESGAATFVESFAGEALYIPRNAGDEVRARHAAIAEALARGEKPADIARRYTYTARYSERWVRAIAAQGPSPQAELFATKP